MFKLTIVYTDNTTSIQYFESWEDADWCAHMEGDHVLDYTITKESK